MAAANAGQAGVTADE
ncbi:hypothetical protein QP282_07130 [Escherichia coli]|nr:hypothetical protein [Escherichia coli]MCV1956742.1 hypothetical protein [Escherichia coli]MDK6583311.1 hypothetical protein [Escherichia coli]